MTKNSFEFERGLFAKTVPRFRYREGENVVERRERVRKKLWELLGLDLFEPCDPRVEFGAAIETENYRKTEFTFQSEAGYAIPCRILFPSSGLKPTPVICLQGHTTGMHISLGEQIYPADKAEIENGDRDLGIRAVKEGFAAVIMEQRYMGECGGDENGPSCLKGRSLASLLIGRNAIGERVWDVSRLIDVLEKEFRDKLNLNNIICTGNSGGGTTTFYAACMDERIKTAIPSCSFCSYYDSIVSIRHCACNYIPNAGLWFDMGDLGGVIAPRRFIVVAGRDDDIFPLEGVKKSFELTRRVYEAAGVPDNCRLVIGEGGHRFYADDAWKAYREIAGERGVRARR